MWWLMFSTSYSSGSIIWCLVTTCGGAPQTKPVCWLATPLKSIMILVGGFNPSEKYEFVSWDDDIPNIWKKHVPNHQPGYIYYKPKWNWSYICSPTSPTGKPPYRTNYLPNHGHSLVPFCSSVVTVELADAATCDTAILKRSSPYHMALSQIDFVSHCGNTLSPY